MTTPPSSDPQSSSIPDIVETLHKRTGRSYADVRELMAVFMGFVGEYNVNNFNRKFRREDASARYELDEVLAIIRAFVEGLPDSKRCRASEAFRLFALTRMSIDDFDNLRDLFPAQEYTAAWAVYAPETPSVTPANDPNFLKPYYPQIFIGRDKDVVDIKIRLGVETKESRRSITVIRGWPGVGKTTLVNRLAHDAALVGAFPDGVLWASLGPDANPFGVLKSWLNQLDRFYAGQDKTIDELIQRVRGVLQGKNILLIVDDVWTPEHGEIFKRVATEKNTLLMTTRFTYIAERLGEVQENVYFLDVLSDRASLELLRKLAPNAVQKHERSLDSLIKTLEGLPLALRVAGSLLEKEQILGLDVEKLIRELDETYILVKQEAPDGYFDERTGQTPSISLLFQRSVETLQPAEQTAFADLGVFASKPATFDLAAIAYVCELEDAIPTTKALVDHGLLEPLGHARFQMHYTLSMYAKSLQDDDEAFDEE